MSISDEVDKLKKELQDATKSFLRPENLSRIGATITKYQATLFEQINQITSDDFDEDIFEEAAILLGDIEDLSAYQADIHSILSLQLRIQRKTNEQKMQVKSEVP